MQILENISPLAPQVLMRAPQATWLLTAALIVLFVALQQTGLVIPIPFLLLLVTVALSGAIAGARSGAISGLLMSGFIIYSWSIGHGPEALTGNLVRALLGCLVSTALGTYLGLIRDQLVSSYSELQTKRKELALFGEELATRVRSQTRDLEIAQGQLREQQARLQRITRRWIETQEIERRNLARELHDDVGQILTALRINLDSGRRNEESGSAAAKLLGDSTELADTAIDSVRQLSFSLRPSLLDDLGLAAAIREYASQLLRSAGIGFELTSEGDDRSVDPKTGIAVFRIVQEAISNVLKHADAHHVAIRIKTGDDSLCVEINDDGKGFDFDSDRNLSEHFGLASMRERASLAGGEAVVDSAVGSGTTIRIRVPFRQQGFAA